MLWKLHVRKRELNLMFEYIDGEDSFYMRCDSVSQGNWISAF